jgi:hypothetical protein
MQGIVIGVFWQRSANGSDLFYILSTDEIFGAFLSLSFLRKNDRVSAGETNLYEW